MEAIDFHTYILFRNWMLKYTLLSHITGCHWVFLPLKLRPPRCFKTAGTNHHLTLRYIPEDWRTQLDHCESLKTRIIMSGQNSGVQTFYGTGPHSLSWAGSRAASGKIKIREIPNRRHYCLILLVCTEFTSVAADRILQTGGQRVGDSRVRVTLLFGWVRPSSTQKSVVIWTRKHPPESASYVGDPVAVQRKLG